MIVAALEVCSRPPSLKHFLYLDFLDRSKFDNVWDKLVETIRKGELVMHCTLDIIEDTCVSINSYTSLRGGEVTGYT